MDKGNNRLEIFRGESRTVFCAISNSDGPMDLTGWDAQLLARKNSFSSGDVDVSVSHLSVDVSASVYTFNIGSTDSDLPSGDYKYQINITKGSDLKVVVSDILTIKESL
jgi:hypothetical protein